MLYKFLRQNREAILAMTERKSLALAGVRASSTELKQGLPIFYEQLIDVLRLAPTSQNDRPLDKQGMVDAAIRSDEPAMASAAGHPFEAALAESAGRHGTELLRLGYTLSHVVHAYGAMCQAITELAMKQNIDITSGEFHDLNRCLDVAIAGSVTEFQAGHNSQEVNRELQHLGFLAHEMRNAVMGVNISLQLIKKGTVGFGGSTGQVLEKGLKRIEALIDRSLTEVRLRVDPKLNTETVRVAQLIDQIVITAGVEAEARNQVLQMEIASDLVLETDQQLLYSVLSNLIQNALKYTPVGGTISVRGNRVGENVVVEIEDECGGHLRDTANLFKPFIQQHDNRKGLGLGLTIVQRAMELNHGTVEAHNLPDKGCIFRVTIPISAA